MNFQQHKEVLCPHLIYHDVHHAIKPYFEFHGNSIYSSHHWWHFRESGWSWAWILNNNTKQSIHSTANNITLRSDLCTAIELISTILTWLTDLLLEVLSHLKWCEWGMWNMQSLSISVYLCITIELCWQCPSGLIWLSSDVEYFHHLSSTSSTDVDI